jgi:hypothetical protein
MPNCVPIPTPTRSARESSSLIALIAHSCIQAMNLTTEIVIEIIEDIRPNKVPAGEVSDKTDVIRFHARTSATK